MINRDQPITLGTVKTFKMLNVELTHCRFACRPSYFDHVRAFRAATSLPCIVVSVPIVNRVKIISDCSERGMRIA
jgi:hypothetical protein